MDWSASSASLASPSACRFPLRKLPRFTVCSALLLSEINPDRADTIMARGYMYGESRVIVGAHWQSDVDAGRLVASVAYAKLHTS